jgi:DNA-binding transcriptional ArsR family regulator
MKNNFSFDLYKLLLIMLAAVHAFDVLGDPVRRRILELLTDGERSSGAVCAVIQEEFGISQPAVSQHLRVLRESGFATVRPQGTRRLYAVNDEPLREIDAWLGQFRRFWTPPLEALATELARGRRRLARSDGDRSKES